MYKLPALGTAVPQSATLRILNALLLATIVTIATIATIAVPARAELGGKLASVDADKLALGLVGQTTSQNPHFTVHQITDAALTVWEFAGADGTVFAVGWKGLNHPDLSQLFGSYFSEYSASVTKSGRSHGHRHTAVKSDHLIVEKAKVLREAHGLAYVPDLLPPQVTPADLGQVMQ